MHRSAGFAQEVFSGSSIGVGLTVQRDASEAG